MKSIYIHDEELEKIVKSNLEQIKSSHQEDPFELRSEMNFADEIIFTDPGLNTQKEIYKMYGAKNFAHRLESIIFSHEIDCDNPYTTLKVLKSHIQDILCKEAFIYSGSKENFIQNRTDGKFMSDVFRIVKEG